MNTEQYIPYYKEDFRKHPWKCYETEHYIFHVEQDSVANNEITYIEKRQEEAFKKIVSTLGVPVPHKKINYYFYTSELQKDKFMGNRWYAQAIYKDFAIHCIYNKEHRVVGEHEDTHLLTLSWGLSIGLFQEGLAEYMVGHSWYGESHNEGVREAQKNGVVFSVESFMEHQAWLDSPQDQAFYYYCFAGSFVQYLINKYGIEKFKDAYHSLCRTKTKEENCNSFYMTYDLKVGEAERVWKERL